MLNFIRERAQGWLAAVIVGLLIIPFALWGINEYFGAGGQVVVANVNDTEINQRDFQEAFYDQRARMQQMLGEQYDSRVFDEQIKQRTIKELVDQELLIQNADDVGYRVSDETVAATIRSIDAFREDGAFSNELYQQQLQAQGENPSMFESRVKRMMLISQLPDGLGSTVLVTDNDIDEAIRLQKQTRELRYLVLPTSKYRNESVATDEAIKSYYEQNTNQFMTTEQVSVEYVELSVAAISEKLAKDSPPTEQQLREYFESTASQYTVPEERKARHILIQVEEGADEATINKAREKIEAIQARIKAGESFEALAKELSEDPGSSELGGDLGYFGRGIMDPGFEDAAYSLKVGEVSEPVMSSFGFHLIKLEDIRESQSRKFEDVRDSLVAEYQKNAAEREYFDVAEKLTNLAYEIPDSLSEVASQLDLELKKSPFFGRTGGPGIFSNQRIANAAFSDDVLKQGYNSEPLSVGENHVVVLRLLEHKEA
ncbi:SurA N-terminal domain-containing protein, partial [Kaarinaea lacus]